MSLKKLQLSQVLNQLAKKKTFKHMHLEIKT